MNNLMRAEWFKLLKSRIPYIILAGAFLLTIIQNLTSYSLGKELAGQYGVAILSDDWQFISIWVIAFAAFYTAVDFQHGTIRNGLSLGIDRAVLYVTKLIFTAFFLLTVLLIMSLSATLTLSLLFGFGDFTPGEFFVFLIKNLLLQSLFFIPLAAFINLFAFLFRSTGMTVLSGIAYLIAVSVSAGFFNNFPGGNFKGLLSLYPQYYISELFSLETLSFSKAPAFILKGVAVCFSHILALILIGTVYFRKRDIK